MTTRRELLLALGSVALGVPLASFAQQQAAKVHRIGFLGAASAIAYASRVEALRAGLGDLKYVAGKNLVIEFRWANGNYDRLPDLAADLVRSKVDLIVTHGTPGTRAAKQATATVPIVMAVSGDAVVNGLVASLARPGGNVTGCTFFGPELAAKRIEFLREALPRMRRFTALINPGNPGMVPVTQAMQATAKALKLEFQQIPMQSPAELADALSAMATGGIEAFIVVEDATLTANTKMIADLATNRRIPSIGPREFSDAGGLIGYGVNNLEMFRRAAYFVDRILKGAKPGDLPVEQPTKFETILNMKTAKALGIKFPQAILVRADRVIE